MLKIFLLSANPREHGKLNIAGEFNLIKEEHQKSEYRNEFAIEIIPAANYDNLLEVLMKNENSIIHFSGHGAEEAGLILTDKNHSQKILKTDILKNLIEVLQDKNKHIQCVFLNGCYTDIQAEVISPYVKYVIGMKAAVLDTDAVELSKYFYKCLFGNRTIEAAFEIACTSIEHSIPLSIVDIDENIKRAIYDPALNDETASQPIPKDKIPQLIVNKKLIVDYNIDSETEPLKYICFINYQHGNRQKDKNPLFKLAQKLKEDLIEEFRLLLDLEEINIFIDSDAWQEGKYQDHSIQALRQSLCMLCLWTPNYFSPKPNYNYCAKVYRTMEIMEQNRFELLENFEQDLPSFIIPLAILSSKDFPKTINGGKYINFEDFFLGGRLSQNRKYYRVIRDIATEIAEYYRALDKIPKKQIQSCNTVELIKEEDEEFVKWLETIFNQN